MRLVPPAVVFLLTATYCIAMPYRFITTPIHDSIIDSNPVADSHAAVVAAAFGFQAAGSSIITVRTYDAPTGTILSEDSFDVKVKEEGASQHDENRGRIFAGGIGRDSEGKSEFMLRVYDAETGRFLWEGHLNLLRIDDGGKGITKTGAVLIPNNPGIVRASSGDQERLHTLFSLRAVNPTTGGLVWQDQFAPGSRKGMKANGVDFKRPSVRSIHESVDHIFDLSVRTYDRTTGTLLWQDSFEQLDRIEAPAAEPDTNAYPQAIPSWTSGGIGGGGSHRTALR